MDEYGCPDSRCYGYAQPFDTYSVHDPYAESYNYTTMDPIALLIRQQREEQERCMFGAVASAAWSHAAPSQSKYFTLQDYESPSDKAFRKAAAEEALLRADDPDAPHSYLAAAAAGRKYYHLPGEPTTWRRPVRSPSRGRDPMWSKMFCHADERSTYLAKQLSYIGARDDDGWICPTRWELFRMGFWKAQRYAFYYAEFATEFGRKIPRWVGFLHPVRAHPPSEEFWI
ncbi:hypothetical protein [Janthinobacterium sp. CAN_S7]|uniref:hypothetical protein n=1 Tax=Janthinobacterium sp. CAN_S7 TaxID=3071704 RepID=UPI00319E5BC9